MKKWIFLITLIYLLIAPFSSFAFWPELNEGQAGEAIKYGQDLSKKLGPDSEWAVASDGKAGWVELTTPFSALAKFARNYAIESKPIKKDYIKKITARHRRKLIFNFYHYTIEKRFTSSVNQEYFATLRTSDNRIIYPIRYETGAEMVEKISLQFSFTSGNIDPSSVVNLLVREPSGYEHNFKFDLSKIR